MRRAEGSNSVICRRSEGWIRGSYLGWGGLLTQVWRGVMDLGEREEKGEWAGGQGRRQRKGQRGRLTDHCAALIPPWAIFSLEILE